MKQLKYMMSVATLLSLVQPSNASVTVAFDFRAWSAGTGPYTTLDFTGLAPDTIITTQYRSLGAVFTDGPGGSSDFILGPSLQTFPHDGWGLDGGLNGQINISFKSPLVSFATHFTGDNQYRFYSGEDLVYVSPFFGADPGAFVGFLSTQAFDRVTILDPFNPVVVVDNIYFGVPGAGTLPLFVTSGVWLGARRRRRL